MKRLIRLFLVFIVSIHFPFCPLFAQANFCVECHMELEDELLTPVHAFKIDIHKNFRLDCADCHGGNPAEEDIDLAKDESFRGVPERLEIPGFCATCHSDPTYMRRYNPSVRVDQLDLYWESRHGHLLKEGDEKVAVCTDCHGTHEILPASHPKSWAFPWNISQTCGRCHSNQEYMEGYKMPTNQWDEYQESVHAFALFEKKDLSAPACNDCHGNHGAAPPEVTSISYVCRQCHPSQADLFSQSPHKEAYDEIGISECEACHGNHKISSPSDEMLGTGEKAVCIQCHEPDSEPYAIASNIKEKLDEFLKKVHYAKILLDQADMQGVEVSEPKFKLTEANTILVMVRNLTHSLSLEQIEEKILEGDSVVAEVIKAGEAAQREARFRKTGLIIVTFFIFLLATALFLKIKQINKKSSS